MKSHTKTHIKKEKRDDTKKSTLKKIKKQKIYSKITLTEEQNMTNVNSCTAEYISGRLFDITDILDGVNNNQVINDSDYMEIEYLSTSNIKEEYINSPMSNKSTGASSYTSSVQQINDIIYPEQSQAVELALASEIEIPSQWSDVSILPSKSIVPATPPSIATSSCLALPTAIQTYVDIPYNDMKIASTSADAAIYENQNNTDLTFDQSANDMMNNEANAEAEAMLNDILSTIDKIQNSNNVNNNNSSSNNNNINKTSGRCCGGGICDEFPNDKNKTTLKEITADADICRCVNCECDPLNGCVGGCGPENPCSSDSKDRNDPSVNSINPQSTRILPVPITQQNNGNTASIKNSSSDCCGGGSCGINNISKVVTENIPVPPQKNSGGCCGGGNITTVNDLLENITETNIESEGCSCKNASEGVANGCCVVICLKTLETLKNVLTQNSNLIKCGSFKESNFKTTSHCVSK